MNDLFWEGVGLVAEGRESRAGLGMDGMKGQGEEVGWVRGLSGNGSGKGKMKRQGSILALQGRGYQGCQHFNRLNPHKTLHWLRLVRAKISHYIHTLINQRC